MVDGFLALGASFFLSPQHRLRKRVNSSRRLPSSALPSASAALRSVRSHPAQKAARRLPFQPLALLPSTSVASPSTRLPPGFALPTRKGTPPFSLPHLIHNFRQ